MINNWKKFNALKKLSRAHQFGGLYTVQNALAPQSRQIQTGSHMYIVCMDVYMYVGMDVYMSVWMDGWMDMYLM